MLILGDKGHYYGRFPWVSVCLVVVNVAMLVPQVLIGDPFNYGLSMVPEEITTGQDVIGPKTAKIWVPEKDRNGNHTGKDIEKDVVIPQYPGPTPIYLTLLTSMFMHGGFWHLFFNMWALLVFGRNVECAMGHWLFLAFYLTCGVFASFAQIASDPHSIIPCLGASGAIAGVMGAYVSIRPFNMITVWFIFIFNLPALFVIGLWVSMEYLSTLLDPNQTEGVATWAHLGGFFAGVIFIRLLVFVLRLRAGRGTSRKQSEPAPASLDSDKYAGYVTMQTVRRMQEKKNRDQGQ